MSTAKQKGDLLEYAVHQIEEALITQYPALAGAEATIERNRIFTVDGVRHEADLWITVAPNTPYETQHLIECKNYKKPVGSGEVHKLAEKKSSLRAAKALLIARQFTRDATNAAKKHGIQLAKVSDDFWSPIDALRCIATSHQCKQALLSLNFYKSDALERTGPINSNTPCQIDGRPTMVGAYIEPLLMHHLGALGSRDPRINLEGQHTGRTEFAYDFDHGEFKIKDEEVARVVVKSEYVLDVSHGKLSVKFSVEGRGGFVRMEYPNGTFGLDRPSIEILTAVPR